MYNAKFKVQEQEYNIEVEDIDRAAFSLIPKLIPLDAYKILDELGYSIEFHKK